MQVAPLSVRPATAADLIRIHEMEIESYGPQTTPITGLIWLVERQGELPSLFLSVGEEEGGLVGFVAWKEQELSPGVLSMEVLQLVIAKHFRNEGLGENLLRAILDSARDRGLRGASMHVPAKHLGAVSLLQKLGFYEYDRSTGLFTEGEGIIFVKVLNHPI